MVREESRAWHAGRSAWSDIEDVNSWSIGIELANPGHHLGYPPFAEPQLRALENLLSGIVERWQIPPERIVGHSCIAPGRKIDPGEKLDWRRLALGGFGVWIDPPVVVDNTPGDAASFRNAADRFGYAVDDGAGWTEALQDVWQAFAMRFLGGSPLFGLPPTAGGVAHLEALAERWPAKPFTGTGP